MIPELDSARRFAVNAHDSINQKRKYSGEPYWVHCDEVASLVSEVTDETPVIQAAFLHDVIEDVGAENEQFGRESMLLKFGLPVVDLVLELTNEFTSERYPELDRSERKRRERERLWRISDKAITIKVADVISNTANIVSRDPEFAAIYLREKQRVLLGMSGASEALLARARKLIDDQLARL